MERKRYIVQPEGSLKEVPFEEEGKKVVLERELGEVKIKLGAGLRLPEEEHRRLWSRRIELEEKLGLKKDADQEKEPPHGVYL